jgi:hypothetical protein
MRVQCTLIGCCYKLTSSGRNNRREQYLLVQQPSRVGKLLWSSVVLLLSGRCSSQQKDEHTYYWGGLRVLLVFVWFVAVAACSPVPLSFCPGVLVGVFFVRVFLCVEVG